MVFVSDISEKLAKYILLCIINNTKMIFEDKPETLAIML